MTNNIVKSIFAFIGVLISLSINHLLFKMLVPDICVYHNGKEPGFIIDNFYSMNSVTGFHPEPNILNILITITLGALFGLMIYKLINSQLKNKNNT